jgi:iron complex transport system substrate-binding protein
VGHDAPVAPHVLLAVAVAALGCLTGCRRPAPWQAADWRPASPPQRIVAASVLATETLLAIAPRERLAGVHVLAADARYSLVADEAKGLPLVGADPEQLLAARPDLVVCDAFTRPETLALLAAADVPVVQTATPTSFADIAANLRRIGAVCWLDAPAAALVAQMEQRLAALAAHAGECAGWRVASLDGALHTYGRGSLFDAMVAAAGARNLAGERGVGPFRKLDVETVLGWRPDALVLGGADAADAADGAQPAWLAQQPGLALLPCAQRARCVRIPSPLLATTSHRLVDAAARLQDALRQWGRP